MTPAERKAAQRRRDKIAGWAEVTVRIDAARAEEVRAFAATLPPPPPPTDPAQLSLLDQLDALLAGADASPQDLVQPSFF
ncbi:MAG: hypothetical protein KGK00_06990 [Paracoccaceae bacterium]|nr:hypothetical protein [Paracoccaceae bacterium]